MTKSRLGTNPLSALLGTTETGDEEAAAKASKRGLRAESPRPKKTTDDEDKVPRAERVSTLSAQLPKELVEELRAAAVFLERARVVEGTRPEGDRDYWTVAGIVEEALEKELVRLRKKHNDGEPFPTTRETPRPGARPGRRSRG